MRAFNERARAVYSKVGYQEEGVCSEATFDDGRFHDEVFISATARD